MNLTDAQVTLLKEAQSRFLGNTASRGINYHVAMEEFMEEALKVVLPPPIIEQIESPSGTWAGLERTTYPGKLKVPGAS